MQIPKTVLRYLLTCISCNSLLGFRSVDLLICFIFVGNTQIKWLVDTFRAKIVDISEDSVTIEVIAAHICLDIFLVVNHCDFDASFSFVCIMQPLE